MIIDLNFKSRNACYGGGLCRCYGAGGWLINMLWPISVELRSVDTCSMWCCNGINGNGYTFSAASGVVNGHCGDHKNDSLVNTPAHLKSPKQQQLHHRAIVTTSSWIISQLDIYFPGRIKIELSVNQGADTVRWILSIGPSLQHQADSNFFN
jgi:hypothetical protein